MLRKPAGIGTRPRREPGRSNMSKLVIVFDYSGTLSLEAVAFAKDDVLERQLLLSGLAEFGVASPEVFWNRIVAPTWEEGSRTTIGYRRLMVEKISEEWTVNRKATSLAALDKAAGIFVAQYFSHSRIDPFWRTLLWELYNHPLITTVVATDHYAEATEAIIGQFQEMQMKALPLPTAGGARAMDRGRPLENAFFCHSGLDPKSSNDLKTLDPAPVSTGVTHRNEGREAEIGLFKGLRLEAVAAESRSCFFIANSADLGYHKDEEEFWVRVREQAGWTPGDRLLLVDDFGANEVAGDHYGQEARVAVRRQRTTELLTKVFDGRVEIVPFILSGDESSRNGEVCLLIGRIADKIREFLREGSRPHV